MLFCLVSGYPTDPNIFGPTQTFLSLFGYLSLFVDFKKRFLYFFHTKMFLIKKVCLPTDPKNYQGVTQTRHIFLLA